MKAQNKHLATLSELSTKQHPKTLDAQKSYALCMLAMDVKKCATVLDATKMEVAKKYPSKEKDAQPGQIDQASVSAFLDDIKPVMDAEIDLTDVQLTFAEAREFDLTAFQMADLLEIGMVVK
jgi:hypothetical protein